MERNSGGRGPAKTVERPILIGVEYPATLVARMDVLRRELSAAEGRLVSRRDILTRLLSYALDFRDSTIADGHDDPIAVKLGYQK